MEIFREWQRTRTFKTAYLEVGGVLKDYDFHLAGSVEDNLEDMNALPFNYWLAKLYLSRRWQIRRAAAILHERCMVSYAV